MRTDEEIKRHIRALMVLKVKPCDCHLYGRVHTMKCITGAKMMQVSIDMLKWVLGSDDKKDFVETLNRAADEFTRGG